ncbi:MAG: ankyrin repeat domain-containing protein [Gammaproteobacteria bacterium]
MPKLPSIEIALQQGELDLITHLIRSDANVHYVRDHRYNAMIDAACSRDAVNNQDLLKILSLLIREGVDLNQVSSYSETALRVLSRIGRFDAVGLLLDAGADESQLAWTPLLRAVALGSVADVREQIAAGESIACKDHWERTPWLIAVQTGDAEKAQCLLDSGAATDARGKCDKPCLHYAVLGRDPAMLRRLLELGVDVDLTDEFGGTALGLAVDFDDLECVETLLGFGASITIDPHGPLLGEAISDNVAACLLENGAELRHLPTALRRARVGLPPEKPLAPIDCTAADFAEGRSRRFGRENPEEMHSRFWMAMIMSGAGAYRATDQFQGPSSLDAGPVWCAERFGQSYTPLEDGRVIEIGGEHEDSYDSDFCIYNDVFVHQPGEATRIFGYPKTVFPPTDFHTTTLIGNSIYVVGSLGYRGERRYGQTQVFRLNTSTLHMERLTTSGDGPGWISEHRAELIAGQMIRVSEGTILSSNRQRETRVDNCHVYELDVQTLVWRRS